MKAHLLLLSSLLMTACAANTGAVDSTSAAVTTAAPVPTTLAPSEALVAMKQALPSWAPVAGTVGPVGTLSPVLAARFARAKTALESFAYPHSDQGNVGSRIEYVYSDATRATFLGYAVEAEGGDDAD